MSILETPVLIGRKRDGDALTHDELLALVAAYGAGTVDDAQMAAFLMAGVIRGFTRDEAVALTQALVESGEQIDLSELRGPTVDKHSTGGVGDTTTLVVGPIVAAAGCQLAKLSGRGLGHTGGTLDKLEAIPGFRVDLTADELHDQVERDGLAIAAATQDLVPADKRLYALRDVTGTVASPALIASSVMSKKLAGGASHVLLDVKAGDGAFMTDVDAARDLARLCVEIGEASGRRTGALVTDMDQPLGDAIGNAIEVGQAIEVLQGERHGRLRELSLELAAAVLVLTGRAADEARDESAAILDDGRALESFRKLIRAQGGDESVCERPWEILPVAPVRRAWRPGAGVVQAFACRRLGELAARLGAGRMHRDDTLDLAVGLDVHVRIGDALDDGDVAVVVHARTEAAADEVTAELGEAVRLGDQPVPAVPLVHDRIGLDEG